jgi:hypothetical protein
MDHQDGRLELEGYTVRYEGLLEEYHIDLFAKDSNIIDLISRGFRNYLKGLQFLS